MITPSTTAQTSKSLKEVDPKDVQRLLADGRATLVDVREPDEFRQERIAGAINLPLSRFDPSALPSAAGRTTILHCKSGRRSFTATEKLFAAGHGQATHMRGGLEAWKAAGLPTAIDRKAPFTAMQQTQIAIGTMVLASVAAGAFWNPWALVVAAFMACGMIYAGLSGTCGLATLLAKAPWNRAQSCGAGCSTKP